ncbi:MAG: hypothetical protein ABWY37_05760 [Microbacterium pygmaeum]
MTNSAAATARTAGAWVGEQAILVIALAVGAVMYRLPMRRAHSRAHA